MINYRNYQRIIHSLVIQRNSKIGHFDRLSDRTSTGSVTGAAVAELVEATSNEADLESFREIMIILNGK